jgi:hypothetical protein
MMRACGILTLVITACPLPASAQTGPEPGPEQGDRVRIVQLDGSVVTGTLDRHVSGEVGVLIDSTGEAWVIPEEEIESLERSLGPQRRFGKYLGLTVAASSLTLGTIAAVTWEPCEGWFCFGPESSGEAFILGAAGGVILGLPLGAIIGAIVKEERWESVSPRGTRKVALTVRPVVGRQIGFSASLAIGPRRVVP